MEARALAPNHRFPSTERPAQALPPGRTTFLQRLDALPAFHKAVRCFRLRQIAGMLLHAFPRHFEFLESGARYRSSHLETFLLADEIFERRVYHPAIDPAALSTFMDLGSNVGLFAVLLAHLTRRRDLRGLMIDANPRMVKESRWHLAANKLSRVVALHGLVGSVRDGGTSPFHLLPSNLGSSQFRVYEPGKPSKGKWRTIWVPTLHLEEVWSRYFGGARCHLLKIDIEGSEARLLKTERRFLERVDSIVLEWHKWLVSEGEIHRELQEMGFRLAGTLVETATNGIGWYRRDASAAYQPPP